MSGCERGWPGYPPCAYPPPPPPPPPPIQSHHHHHHHLQPPPPSQWSHYYHHYHHHHHHPQPASVGGDYCGSNTGFVSAPPPHHSHHLYHHHHHSSIPTSPSQPPHCVGYGHDPPSGGFMGGGAVYPPSCTAPYYWDGDDLVDGFGRVVKRRSSANRKERRRTQSINNAFAELRDCIPNVPADTKLSKIKTLRLATSYIAYLMGVLRTDAHEVPAEAFKAELPPKPKTPHQHEKDESDMEAEESMFSPRSESPMLPEPSSSIPEPPTSPPSSSSPRSSPAIYYSAPSSLFSLAPTPDQTRASNAPRTGWPESVWSRDLRF